MKAKKILYILLMLLPLAVTLLALPILPDQIPAHYDFNNQVTRWGSKYEMLVMPALTIVVGIFMLWMAKVTRKQEGEGENNYKICVFAGMLGMGVFTAMTVYFLYAAFIRVENLNTLPLNLDSLLWTLLGLMLILLGNVMPKAKKNSLLGLRTKWSMSSDEAWKKSQRFGGIAAIVSGAAMLLMSFLTKGMTCTLICLCILTAMVILDTVYSYEAAKK